MCRTYSGRVVYDRKSRPFILPRIAKIFQKIMNRFPEIDPVTETTKDKTYRRYAPTSTIFFFYQQSKVWLQNRGVYDELIGNYLYYEHLRPLLERKSDTDATVYGEMVANFLKFMDNLVAAVTAAANWVETVAPELKPLVEFLAIVVKWYRWVREVYQPYVLDQIDVYQYMEETSIILGASAKYVLRKY